MCRFNRDGLSKAFPQTSHGKSALSPLIGLVFGDLWALIGVSRMSPEELAAEEASESPDIDLCSSSVPLGGDIGSRTLERSDIDKSNGESERGMRQSSSVKFDYCRWLTRHCVRNEIARCVRSSTGLGRVDRISSGHCQHRHNCFRPKAHRTMETLFCLNKPPPLRSNGSRTVFSYFLRRSSIFFDDQRESVTIVTKGCMAIEPFPEAWSSGICTRIRRVKTARVSPDCRQKLNGQFCFELLGQKGMSWMQSNASNTFKIYSNENFYTYIIRPIQNLME